MERILGSLYIHVKKVFRRVLTSIRPCRTILINNFQSLLAYSLKKKPLQAKERIILPLDTPSLEMARPLIRLLKDHVGMFKIGLTLFIKEGLHVIDQVRDLSGGREIFLDLKLYDTPMQVGRAAAALHAEVPNLRFLTVHCSGGIRVIKAVVDAMSGGTDILGVTALTSQNASDLSYEDKITSINEQVLALAKVAKEAAAAGIVASAHEAFHLKKHFGNTMTIVTPGIRPAWAGIKNDDQRRIMSPAEAISKGADYLVIGRPIYDHPDPAGAAEKVADEIASASQ